MRPARIIILAVAVVSAGVAGLLALKVAGGGTPVQPEAVVEREPTVNVLVARESLPVGARLNPETIAWTAWPEGSVAEGFITDQNQPDAMENLNGAIARMPIFNGEPIRQEKIADSSNRIMSSLLPSGKRAVATEISVATGAGGFILPNDRVDVIMVRKSPEGSYITETVLSNVRVLAIDQQIQENEDGSKSAVGTTATLELTPDQTKVIAVAQQMAERLSLALRSIADAQESDTGAADYLLSGGDGMPIIQVIKTGEIVNGGEPAAQK
ncbi:MULTISPECIES: Flp pilus assembly protein CpaB [unclassified Shinella]|jgi:pilus assembly protein CpaB|uniref:Flp pilus assembly protein CpaB n=1 Tax=unclassified Shinella TaxID=2643062 RepID=UPI0004379A69|nr:MULTISPECIES: Flp pilus assembly protein CpaB [unclassified Shinella]MCA0338719.1 Flp pilus assembly protein CpaB [Pseudomonadota bacterium]EYR80337.1 Flp pilus assembly protein CpaB [Shinella sp. DD12]KNY18907.1 pilus assembly protein CpaB [Shinella sp. SUS2]KOC76296.1 pilus assembly protein CpaB [Shinella sp. GWS1]MCO5152975.1 Flp pilus assembly protein CpaB [Shinella sp.]